MIPPPRRQPWYRSVLSNPLYAVLAVAGVLIVGGAAAFGITQLVSDEGTTTSNGERAGATGSDDTRTTAPPPTTTAATSRAAPSGLPT